MTEKLIHCPFCGGKVHWCKCGSPDPEHPGCHYIECPGCDSLFDLAGDANPETLEELRVIVTEKWRNRCPEL